MLNIPYPKTYCQCMVSGEIYRIKMMSLSFKNYLKFSWRSTFFILKLCITERVCKLIIYLTIARILLDSQQQGSEDEICRYYLMNKDNLACFQHIYNSSNIKLRKIKLLFNRSSKGSSTWFNVSSKLKQP